MMASQTPAGAEPAGEDAAPAAVLAVAARACAQNNQLVKKVAEPKANLAIQLSRKNDKPRTKVCSVIILAAFCGILIFNATMVWQGTGTPPPSAVKRSKSAPKRPASPPVRKREIHAEKTWLC